MSYPSANSGDAVDEYVDKFLITKNSWKGKYSRIFCIGKSSIATINPKSLFTLTNVWEYRTALVDIVCSDRSPVEFTLVIKKNGKSEAISFLAATNLDRAEVLTASHRFRHIYNPAYENSVKPVFSKVRRFGEDGEFHPCSLHLTCFSLNVFNENGNFFKELLFMNIKGFSSLHNKPDSIVIVYGSHVQLFAFELEGPRSLRQRIQELATKYIGMPHFKEINPLTTKALEEGLYGINPSQLNCEGDFIVTKYENILKDNQLVRRSLSFSNNVILEREASTYQITEIFFLSDLYAIVRDENDQQRILLEYKNPRSTLVYLSASRDMLLVHLLDICRRSGNTNVFLLNSTVDAVKRLGPLHSVVSEEIESTLLHALIEPAKIASAFQIDFTDIVRYFNTNVLYNGLQFTQNRDSIFAENREKMIFAALSSILQNFPVTSDPELVAQQFHALRRLCVTRIGFASTALVPSLIKAIGATCGLAIKLNNSFVSYAVIDSLNTLMTPHHNNYDELHEILNKNRILKSESFIRTILTVLCDYISTESSSFVVQAALDFFVYAVCPPYSHTTSSSLFGHIIEHVTRLVGKKLFDLLQHPSSGIRLAAGQLIRVIMEEGSPEDFAFMQRAALSEGGFLAALHTACFDEHTPLRILASKLLAYWSYENYKAQDILRLTVPLALLHYLKSSEDPPDKESVDVFSKNVTPMTEEFLESKTIWFKKKFRPLETLVIRKAPERSPVEEAADEFRPLHARMVRVESSLNWPMFFYQIKQDHLRPDLIWNHTTRSELRDALETELRSLKSENEDKQDAPISWNYQEFEVVYRSLEREIKIGDHYPRLLFESEHPIVAFPKEFFNDLYHHFLIVQDDQQRLECLRGMAVLYKHYAEPIGHFNDMAHIIRMLSDTSDPALRDRLLIFILHLLGDRRNIKLFIDCDGVSSLIGSLSLAHLHVDRPTITSSTNFIQNHGEGSGIQDAAKEWYYTKNDTKEGPVSFTRLEKLYTDGEVTKDTKVWAQGLAGWKTLMEVPQLRWGIVTKALPKILNFTEVTCTILDIFILLANHYPTRNEEGVLMRPLPKIKRYLSSPSILPHIVQLLLTFDPSVTSRVHQLLYLLMEDNPNLPRFFLTGIFFFALMYNASDILPMCRLLSLCHYKQSFRYAQDNSPYATSILFPLLPPAMVAYLTSHGPEKFAHFFLGDFETPEVIWGTEMRRHLIGKIAQHLGDFTARLIGNNSVTYQYCPIIKIIYPQLNHELFCSKYYLRHLCDDLHYSNWPIDTPVELLSEVLETWRREMNKNTSYLSRDACLSELEMDSTAAFSPQEVRKAYFKLASQFHPDKNPQGRERFEAIQKAYEYLLSGEEETNEPNPHVISLLLQTQSILFKRFSAALSHYKYAGYGLLLALLKMEKEATDTFDKEVPLMTPAIELCYFTVENVPLNADELREEGGIALLADICKHTFDTPITPNSTPDMEVVKVATFAMKTFRVAAAFPECRSELKKDPSVPFLASRGCAFENTPELSRACIEACAALSVDEVLFERLLFAGALWHLLLFLFRYDQTLPISSMNLEEGRHMQLFANNTAHLAFSAIQSFSKSTHPIILGGAKLPILPTILEKLLTPYITKKIFEANNETDPKTILTLLNENMETPYFLWNNRCRSELSEFLKQMSDRALKTPIHECDESLLDIDSFSFSFYEHEVILDGIFVRVYNEQPRYPIDNPVSFSEAIFSYLAGSDSTPHDRVALVLTAFSNLFASYPKKLTAVVEKHVSVLFHLLCHPREDITSSALNALIAVSIHLNILASIGAYSLAIPQIIRCLHSHYQNDDYTTSRILTFLQRILEDRGVAQQALDGGLFMFLLHLYATGTKQDIREEACLCLAKLFADQIVGPKVFLLIANIIPRVLAEMIRENPTQACHLLESSQDSPEFFWNSQSKKRLIEFCTECCRDISTKLEQNETLQWKLPPIPTDSNSLEIIVGDINLSAYIAQSGWAVRKPKDFLLALLERYCLECNQLLSMQNESSTDVAAREHIIELIVDCGERLLEGTPSSSNYFVSLGYVQKILQMLSPVPNGNPKISHTALRWTHMMFSAKSVVENLSSNAHNRIDPVKNLLACMKAYPTQTPLVLDSLERLVIHSAPQRGANMIRFCVDNQLVEYLLKCLAEGVGSLGTDGPLDAASTRALIIRVLKTIDSMNDSVYGKQVTQLLEESAVWKRYKSQSHDMFLARTPFGGLLTGEFSSSRQNGGTTMLSLQAAPANYASSTEPPPLTNP